MTSKETFIRAYDSVMSKLGIESFCIQWNHAYTPPSDEYKRHLHVVLSQTVLPITHAKIEALPFPLRKFIIIGQRTVTPRTRKNMRKKLKKDIQNLLCHDDALFKSCSPASDVLHSEREGSNKDLCFFLITYL